MSQIIIAFPGDRMSEKIRSVLMHSGIQNIQIVSNGREALREMQEGNTGILICPVRLKDMDYTGLLADLPQFFSILLIDSAQAVAGRRESDVMALTLPVKGTALTDTVFMMLAQMEHIMRREKKKRREMPKKRTPEEQKKIDDAKAILMERNHMTEPEAFRYIQKNSMDMGRSLVETAEMVIAMI